MAKVVVCITGASGIQLAVELIRSLKGNDVDAVVSEGAKKVAEYEGVDLGEIHGLCSNVYDEEDLASPIASSSNLFDAVVVVPASVKSVSSMASGYCVNLVTRVVENAFKMGSDVVVVPRETPLSQAALENLTKLKSYGAFIVPPMIAFYPNPKTIDDVISFSVGKILDCLRIDHSLYRRWKH